MYKIKIICPKNHSVSWIEQAVTFYKKKLKNLCTLELLSPKESTFDKLIEKSKDYIALDINKTSYTSLEFADFVFQNHNICFVIGPSNGLTSKQKSNAKALISLSKLTLTHQQSKVILLEQIYRSFQIKNNTPYHK